MKSGRTLLAMMAVCSASALLPRTAAADEWNRRTMLTFSKTVEIPGKVLPAGTYVFELADLPASRHVVRVFDRDGRILATFFTVSTLRRTAAGDTRITFEEDPANAAFPIRKWFYPGQIDGEEFVYPTRAK